MTTERILGVVWLHARRLIEAALEASVFAIAAGASVAMLRTKGLEIPLQGETLDPARFFAGPAAFLGARLVVAEARRLEFSRSPRLALPALAGAVFPLFCLAVARGFELASAYIPIPVGALDAAFWGAWTLIPIVAATAIALFEPRVSRRPG